MAKLESDLTWFDAPVSIQPGTLQDTSSILKFQMKSSEVAVNAYIGLKTKYPGLEIDKTGILFRFGKYFKLSNSGALVDTKSEEDTKAEDKAPQMIDGKPAVFASMDICEKKNANEDEEE